MNFASIARESSPSRLLETPTVFVVDDDASVRDALELMVRCAGWQARVAASAEEFLERPRATTPSCLLAELSLPGMSGLELQKLLVDRAEMPIIFMSRYADVQATVRAMKAGAFEVLTKPYARDALLGTIRRALECSREALRRQAQLRLLQDRFESLSPRERDVMALVVTGRMNKQVGGELGISEITVKAHRGKLMRKMQAGSLAELVVMAALLGRGVAETRSRRAATWTAWPWRRSAASLAHSFAGEADEAFAAG